MEELDFYNQQFEKFGRYDHATANSETSSPDHPESYFANKIKQLSSTQSTLVDLGCGDGGFTATLAENYQSVIGIEPSKLIQAALKEKERLNLDNLQFLSEKAEQLSLADNSVDVVISRRGPDPAEEIARILKPNGIFIFITIGEEDCLELKQLVGRGQHFNSTEKVSQQLSEKFCNAGFEINEAKDFYFEDQYENEKSLIDFLHQVPIFDAFGEQDYEKVSNYCAKRPEKISLKRHRVVLQATLRG